MSSPATDDAENQGLSASPPALFDHESEEVRQLHDKVAAAAELLINDSREPPVENTLPELRVNAFELVRATRSALESEESGSRLRSLALLPALIPPLPDDDDDSAGLIAMGKLGFAIGLAAGVAYVVTSMVQLPGSGPTMARETTAVLSNFTQISAAQAGIPKNDVASVPATAILAAAQADIDIPRAKEDAATPAAPALAAAPVRPVESAPPPVVAIAPPAAADVAPPPAAIEVTPAPPSPPPRATALPRDEAAALMKRGRDLLAVGDIASARLILAKLADSGEADASLLLAGTFDPAQLARLHLRGVVPDIDKARAWYKKAAEQGSSEAGRHLQQSASR